MKRKNVMRFLATAITVCMMSTNVTWAASDVSTPPVETDQGQSDVPEETGENGQDQETEGNEETTVVPEVESEPEEETENSENGIALQDEESETEEQQTPDEENSEVSESTVPEEGGQTELKENSWRYQDGQLIDAEISLFRSAYPNAWGKENGHYVNSIGEVIPGAVKKGVDVSEHNGTINWEAAKADGVEFAIIRCGYGSDYTSQDDDQWLHNVTECERLGIPYGVYLYSYANTLDKARSEAQHVLRLLNGHTPTYPVYYDLEDNNTVATLSSSMKAQISQIFCDTVSAAGYKVGIYSNLDWWTNYLTDPVFESNVSSGKWSRWVAQYNTKCNFTGKYDMWQCTSKGQINGITDGVGTVDINFWMVEDTPEETTPVTSNRTVAYDEGTGSWCAFKDGVIDTGYTGVVGNEYGYWYIKNGFLDWSYTGVAGNEYGYWYIRNGGLDWSYTGVAGNEYGYWYIKNGGLDWSYTGVASNEYGYWYIKNGALDWSYTGVANNEYGWWYIRNGMLDWSYTGVGINEYGWWYIKNGSLDWSYTGKVTYNGRTYNVNNGSVAH